MTRTALQQLEDLVSDAYSVQGTGGSKTEARRLYDAVRREAAQEVANKRQRISGECWHNKLGQRGVLAGLDIAASTVDPAKSEG